LSDVTRSLTSAFGRISDSSQTMIRHTPPTLVMWGRYDPSFIVPGALAYARDIPDAEIHILDAGHFALDEQADKVAQLTRDFLARRIGPPD
jgi:pimeloyl-ACP methyl ester carboxylesterase